ncbi:MAG: ATPase [Clostridiales Family XIII bacterium]|nr:ATPase [Clostridiales Family XIII bacterium]
MDNTSEARRMIEAGRTALGIELGSTRMKAVLIDEDHETLATGSYDWENLFEDGVWTYRLGDVWEGLKSCYGRLADNVRETYGVTLKTTGSIGISAMMHGYLVFDKSGNQLVPFRTWRNTSTGQAAAALTQEFGFNIPQRWSIAHLYQAMLNGEAHVRDIDFMTTLSGYIHKELTGEKVLGVGDASGMFPINSKINDYDAQMTERFNALILERGYDWTLESILPSPLVAGGRAGALSSAGAALLDSSGELEAGIPFCPPEGDAGTGMVATNSVAERTGNISAGTSIFAMIVLEKGLSKVYPEIDMVTTPTGRPVAMVHCNNCTTDLDAWVRLFGEFGSAIGAHTGKAELYDLLYEKALEGEPDCGGLIAYNYFAGEPVTGIDQGRPLYVRMPESHFTLANHMRSLLFSAVGTLAVGMDILKENEQVRIDSMLGHGGLFKTKIVGQRLMAAALNVPVSVMETAGEGGAWGIALLADFAVRKKPGETLEAFLAARVFQNRTGAGITPDEEDVRGFASFKERYVKGLAIEAAAANSL